LAAVRAALEPLGAGPALPIRAMREVLYVPADGVSRPRLVHVVVVSDAEADRALAPLAGPADVYRGTDEPLADLVRGGGFPASAAGVQAVRLPESARLLRGLVLVRASAAARLGLEPSGPEPNRLAVTLRQAGSLDAAWGRAIGLAEARGLRFAPVDLAVGCGSAARWMALAALALMLAGGSAAGIGALGALAGVRPPRSIVGEHLVRGARRLATERRAYAIVLGAMAGAVVLGAAWGAEGWRERLIGPALAAGRPDLSMVGLPAAHPGATALLAMLLSTAVGNFVLRAVLLIGLPALAPGLGLAAALGQAVAWGAGLAPATATLLGRLPLRAAVAAVEVHAYAAVALGAWRVLVGTVRPRAVGQTGRRAGYAAGAADLYAVLPLVGAVLLAAAFVETVLVAIVGWSG
jgi:hypothetical protein